MSEHDPLAGPPAKAFNADDVELDAPEKLLDYTQKLRKGLVSDITARGMPEDKDDRQVLLQTLRDMDGTSINRLRLDVDKDVAANAREAQEIIKRLYDVKPHGLREHPVEGHVVNVPDAEIPALDFTSDEKHIGVIAETSVEFMARMKDKPPST